MKKIWNFLKNFIIIAYILLIIFVTISLISYNDYQVTVFGDSTLLPVIDEDLEPDYSVGDLLIIKKGAIAKVNEGDKIFFYRKRFGEVSVNIATVTNSYVVSDSEVTYTVEGDYKFSSANYIGRASDTTVIPKVGRILGILQSKWGFLFLGVFPSLIAFLYTLHSVVFEFIGDDENEDENEKKKTSSKKKKNKKKKAKKEKTDKEEKNEKTEVIADETVLKETTVEEQKEVVEPKTEEQKTEETVVEENNVEVKAESIKQEEIKAGEDRIEENKTEEPKVEAEKTETKTTVETEIEKTENDKKELTEEEKKKAAIEAKMKSMTEEEKKALIKAKLDSMTEEEKRALIEAKRKKLEAEKNKKGEQ